MQYPYRRVCKAQIVEDCINPFRTKYPRSKVCPRCERRIREIGIGVKRYLKMKTNEEHKPKEQVDWTDKDHAKFKYTKKTEMKNQKGEVIGLKEEVMDVTTTYADLKFNYDNTLNQLEKVKDQLKQQEAKLGKFGKIPTKTPEMVKLEKKLQALQKIEQARQIQPQIDNLKEQIQELEDFLSERKKTLDARPEK